MKKAEAARRASVSHLQQTLEALHPLEITIVAPSLGLSDGAVPDFAEAESGWELRHVEWFIPAQKHMEELLKKISQSQKDALADAWRALNKNGSSI